MSEIDIGTNEPQEKATLQCHLYCNVKLLHKLCYHFVNYLPSTVNSFGVLWAEDKKHPTPKRCMQNIVCALLTIRY